MSGTVIKFGCEECSSTFTRKYSLKQHMIRAHQGVKDFQCPKCNEGFTSKHGLSKHVDNKHPTEDGEDCSTMSDDDGSVANFTGHCNVQLEEGQDEDTNEEFKCTRCDISFSKAATLQGHMELLHGDAAGDVVSTIVKSKDGQFKCDECDRTFSRKDGVKRHLIRVHNQDPVTKATLPKTPTSTKDFKCPACDHEYTQAGGVKRHFMTLHSDLELPAKFLRKEGRDDKKKKKSDKNYTCEVCQKSFGKKSTLDAHSKASHAKKPLADSRIFVCETCGKDFTRHEYLDLHKKVSHSHMKYDDDVPMMEEIDVKPAQPLPRKEVMVALNPDPTAIDEAVKPELGQIDDGQDDLHGVTFDQMKNLVVGLRKTNKELNDSYCQLEKAFKISESNLKSEKEAKSRLSSELSGARSRISSLEEFAEKFRTFVDDREKASKAALLANMKEVDVIRNEKKKIGAILAG